MTKSNFDNKIYDCIIVGGGYSGLVASIILASDNFNVLIIEQNEILGRKILSTGNGRCNFTNQNMSKEYFYSESSLDSFDFSYQKSVDFLKSLGVIEKNLDGYFYPITNQAKTVRDALAIKVKELDIPVLLNTKVTKVNNASNYEVITGDKTYISKNIILATGGLAAPSLGSTGEGYKIAKSLGIRTTNLYPSLVGLKSSDLRLKLIAGVRCLAKVTLAGFECEGEVQFNKDSISGYPVMCISRFFKDISKSERKEINIDLVPFFNSYELFNELKNRSKSSKTIKESLTGLLNDKCIDLVISEAKLKQDAFVSELTDKQLKTLSSIIKNISFTITDTKGFEAAQVTAGGIDLSQLNENMMCKDSSNKGLYFVGEICDVDGICGGYNLEWARLSASLAAKDIINRLRKEK